MPDRDPRNRIPTALHVLHETNPSASDVAALAGHRIAEVQAADPRRSILIGLLAITRMYLSAAQTSDASRGAILVFRDVIGAVAGKGISAETYLSRVRDAIEDAKVFRMAVEAVTEKTLLRATGNANNDDTNFKLARDGVLDAFREPEAPPEAK